ncbi:MAG: LamG domain-containing protein [Chloroflexi bacterium]|nr:LamG domain-containing protein [Chloroflexota bacterium]
MSHHDLIRRVVKDTVGNGLRQAVVHRVHGNVIDVRVGGSTKLLRGLRVIGGVGSVQIGDGVILTEADGDIFAQSFQAQRGPRTVSGSGGSGDVIGLSPHPMSYHPDALPWHASLSGSSLHEPKGHTHSHGDLLDVNADDHHALVTIGTGGLSGMLGLSGQELTLADIGHIDLVDVAPDQHHAGFIGLNGDSGSASPDTADRIKVAGGTGIATGASGSVLTVTHATGSLGDLHTNYTEHGANETVTGVWAFQNNLTTRHILPDATDTYDLGSSTKLWRKGWLSELDTVIFAQNTITLLGGWLYVTKYAGTVEEDVSSVQTTINLGVSDLVLEAGDFICLRSTLQVEYIQLGSYWGANIWNVTRDVDGSGANAWPQGAPFACFGNVGDGRVELNAYDTPRISIVKQGATYNAQDELVRLGDLNGLADYTSEAYGIFVGDYAGDSWMAYDQSNGLRVHGSAIIDGTIQATSFTNNLAALFFSQADGRALWGPGCAISPTSWTSARGQVATISGAFQQKAGRWPGTRGLVIEEATTNYMRNPVGNNTAYWSSIQGSMLAIGDSTAVNGTVVRCTANTSLANWYWYQNTSSMSFVIGDKWTLTVRVRSSTNENAALRLYRNWVTLNTRVITITPSWQIFTVTGTMDLTTTDILRCLIDPYSNSNGQWIEIDWIQVEKLGYSTTLCWGGAGTGYAWNGTEHASTSTRTATVVNLDEHVGLISGNETLSYRVIIQAPYDADAVWLETANYILDVYSSTDRVILRYRSDSDKFAVYINGSDVLLSEVQTFEAGDWIDIVVTFDYGDDEYKLYLNGVLSDSDTTNLSVPTITDLMLGSRYTGASHWGNFTFAEFAIFDRVLTAEEVATIYHRGVPLVDSGASNKPGVYIWDGQFLLASSQTGARTLMDNTGWWAYDADDDAAFGLALEDGIAWGGFTLDKSDLVLGHNKADSAAIRWDQSAGTFGFYGNAIATAQVEISTNGSLKAGGGSVLLNSEGIAIATDTTFGDVRSFKFKDSNDNVVSGLYNYASQTANQVYTQLVATAAAADYTSAVVRLHATGGTTGNSIVLDAASSMTTLTVTDSGYVSISGAKTPDLRVAGGIYVGGTSVNPATGTITATDYIVALGGLHVGGTSDPGTDNLIVDADTRIGGGLYVGSTGTNPDSDDIYYDGNLKSVKSSTTYNVYAFHPLTTPITHTSFNGDSFSTGSTATIIQNTSWSSTIPSNAKALLISVLARDNASGLTTGLYFSVGPTATYFNAVAVRPPGGDVWSENAAPVPCTNGDIYYKCSASGTGTMDVYLRVWGYWI